MGKIYTGQTKLTFNFSLGDDITGYSSVTAYIRKPDASTLTCTCAITSVSTGSVYFNSFTTTTLDSSGIYYGQVYVTFTDGTALKSETFKFTVYNNYQ